MHRRLKSLHIARFALVCYPELLSQIYRPLKALTKQYEIDKTTLLDWRCVKESCFRRGQPYAEKERQRPEVKLNMILAGRICVFEQVRIGQAKHALAEWSFPDFATHEVTSLLWRGVYPAVIHSIS